MKSPINPLQRRARAPRRGRVDRNLVFGTWLLVGASALPFGCAGRSEVDGSRGQSGAVDGNIVSGDAVARGGDAATTSRGGSAGRPLNTGDGSSRGGSAGQFTGTDGTARDGSTMNGYGMVRDGSTLNGDGTFLDGRPYSVDGGRPTCCSDGSTVNVAGREGAYRFTDGTPVTDRGDGENEQADGSSEGTPDSEWSDGGPEEGNLG